MTAVDEDLDAPALPPFTLVLTHDDPSRRALWERKATRHPEITVVLSTGTNAEAVACAHEVLPDVVTLIPGNDLIASVRSVADLTPATTILVLEPGDDDFDALTAGAAGALPPGTSELALAVIGAARDESILTPGWAAHLAEAIAALPEPVRRRVVLSETEREVIRRIAAGESIGAIADDHEVADRLVNLHTGFVVAKYQRAVEALDAIGGIEALEDREPGAETSDTP